MEDHAPRALKSVERTEKELHVLLAQKEQNLPGLETQLAKFRSACEDLLFLDFEAACEQKVEPRLWEAHAKVNQKFRPILAKFRDEDGKKKHVERRKAEKLYLEFIKSSMRFYRGYIQRLASHFSGATEVLHVARKFGLDPLTADTPQAVNDQLRKRILKSCYSTLVQLGDLSRYRETELQPKERNWGPAKGYYDLATELDPTAGTSYNQLAVIALNDKDHLRAVYYLYRAISVETPAPLAGGNLDLEFKKLRSRGIQKTTSNDSTKENQELQNRFIMFHARALAQEPSVGHEEQTELLRLLADDLRERPFDTNVRKFCLINIAAEDHAARRADAETLISFKTLHQFNLGTFFLLLKLLLDELQKLTGHAEADRKTPDALKQTPLTRRILPHLRLYSGWLLSSVRVLLHEGADSLKVPVEELFKAYAEALSLLVATFPILDLPDIPYLLDEDRDTLAFTPFSHFVRQMRFSEKGKVKPAHDVATFGPRSMEDEMLYRIKSIVRDGIILCSNKIDLGGFTLPIIFAGNRFNYQEHDSSDEHGPPTAFVHATAHPIHSVSREDIAEAGRSQVPDAHRPQLGPDESSDAGVSTSTMENMVNSLTGPSDQDTMRRGGAFVDGPLTPKVRTPTAATFADRGISQPQPLTFTARDLVQQLHQSSPALTPLQPVANQRTSLPSIWNSPFAPLPGETPGGSPRPPTAQRESLFDGAQGYLNSSAQFQTDVALLQQQAQMRTSPAESYQPTVSSHYNTPSNLTPWVRPNDSQPTPSPWQSPVSSLPVQRSTIDRKIPEASPFGAIGEPRKKHKSPASGQGG